MRTLYLGFSCPVEEYGTDHGVFKKGEQDWPGQTSQRDPRDDCAADSYAGPYGKDGLETTNEISGREDAVYGVDGSQSIRISARCRLVLFRSEECCSFTPVLPITCIRLCFKTSHSSMIITWPTT